MGFPHTFRHTHTALLFEAGARIADVKYRLGHDDIKMTLEVYDHTTSRGKMDAIDKLTTFLTEK
ncbi:MAG TPA: tyrosine-type recombinase/integrase [Tissierellia bacterium]|nr:tyrosine-type recombinase/integrase [Tissierellia bacterium]